MNINILIDGCIRILYNQECAYEQYNTCASYIQGFTPNISIKGIKHFFQSSGQCLFKNVVIVDITISFPSQDRKPLINHEPNYDQKIKDEALKVMEQEEETHDQSKVLEVS